MTIMAVEQSIVAFLAAVGLAALVTWTRAALITEKLSAWQGVALWLTALVGGGALFGLGGQLGCLVR